MAALSNHIYIRIWNPDLGQPWSQRQLCFSGDFIWKTFLPNHRPCLFLPLTWSFREGIHNHCRSCVVSSCALGKWNPLFQENFFQNFCSWGNCLAQLSGALHDSFYKNFCSGKLFDPALWRESCPIGDCPWACGARLHMCKVFDNSYFLLRLQKNWTFENKFSIFSALTPIALTSKLTPGQRPRRNLPELPTTWRPRLAAPPWWTWSTRSRGGRWGRRPGTKSALCVCWGQRQGITSSLLESPNTTPPGKSPPPEPLHLREPTYLNITQEHLHPLQPAPSKIRSFVCAKVFRRDEIAEHLAAVHQTIVPGLSSNWLQIRWKCSSIKL